MSEKLEKLGAEREKARQKRDFWDSRLKELDRKYKDRENAEIQDTVHSYNLTPIQLAELLKQINDGKTNISIEIPGTEDSQESREDENETQE